MAASDVDGCAERDRLQVFGVHLPRHGDDSELTIGFAHGFIEKRGDDAAVHVSRRPLEATRNAYAAVHLLLLGDEELEAQAGSIGFAAAEAVVERSVRKRLQIGGGFSRRLRFGHAVSRASTKTSRSTLPPVITAATRFPRTRSGSESTAATAAAAAPSATLWVSS